MATVNWEAYADGNIFKGSVSDFHAADGLSTAINLGGYLLHTIYMPATWTSAALGFSLSYDGTNWLPVKDINGEVTYSNTIAVASMALTVKPELAMQLQGVLKLRSGAIGAAVQQGATRTVVLIASKISWR